MSGSGQECSQTVNRWFAVLHGMLTPNRSLNPCHVKSIFRRRCIDAAFRAVVHTLAPLVIFRPHLSIDSSPCPFLLLLFLRSCLLPLFLPGGGGLLVPFSVLSSPSLSVLLRGPPFSQFSTGGASENSTFGTQTLMAVRKFLDDAETRSRQGVCNSQGTKTETGAGDAECCHLPF